MKKQLCTVLTVAILATSTAAAFAEATPIVPAVVVDEQTLVLDQAPIITTEGRVLVPMRAIFEALGANVQWEADSNSVFAEKDDVVIRLTVGEKILQLNQEIVTLDASAQMAGDRVMVPVRAVSEALQADVSWDSNAQKVIITTQNEKNASEQALSIITKELAEETDQYHIKINYPQIENKNDDEAVAKLNDVLAQKAQQSFADMQKELIAEAADTSFSDFLLDIRSDITPEEKSLLKSMKPTAEADYDIMFNDGVYLSVLNTKVVDLGGAHPMTYKDSAVYRVADGEALALTDLLKNDESQIRAQIVAGFAAEIDQAPEEFFPEAEEELQTITKFGYYLTKDGLQFYLPLYTLKPYAGGFPQFSMAFDADTFKISL